MIRRLGRYREVGEVGRADRLKGEDIMILIVAIFAVLSMMFFLSAIGWVSCPERICPSSWETQDYLQASLVLATIGMVFFVGLQTYFSRRSLEQMRSSMLLPLMREHTLQLREEAIEPLLELFNLSSEISPIYIDEDKKRVSLIIERVRDDRIFLTDDRVVYGTETLEDLVEYVKYIKANPVLVKDLLNNHAPDLMKAYEELRSKIRSLEMESNPNKKQEIIKDIRKQIVKLRKILLELKAVEVFLDHCEFVKGSKKEERIK